MKKNNLITGIISVLVGLSCLFLAIFYDSKLGSMLFGFAGAGIASGIRILWQYFYWTSDKNKDRYAEKMEIEQIELHDERKQKLRDKSGRYAYILGLLVLMVVMVIISVLGTLDIISTVSTSVIILFLFAYLIFQYVSGIIIFRHLNNKN